MTRVASRELRNDTSGVLRRAASGEPIEITVNGLAVASRIPLSDVPSRWTSRESLIERLARVQADPALAHHLAELDAMSDDLGPLA